MSISPYNERTVSQDVQPKDGSALVGDDLAPEFSPEFIANFLKLLTMIQGVIEQVLGKAEAEKFAKMSTAEKLAFLHVDNSVDEPEQSTVHHQHLSPKEQKALDFINRAGGVDQLNF